MDGDIIKEAVTVESPHRSRLLEEAAACGEDPMRGTFSGRTCDPVRDACCSSSFLKDCTPWKGSVLEQFLKKSSLWEGLTLGKLMKDCLPWERTHDGAEKSEEEGAADLVRDELTVTAMSHCCPPFVGRR